MRGGEGGAADRKHLLGGEEIARLALAIAVDGDIGQVILIVPVDRQHLDVHPGKAASSRASLGSSHRWAKPKLAAISTRGRVERARARSSRVAPVRRLSAGAISS